MLQLFFTLGALFLFVLLSGALVHGVTRGLLLSTTDNNFHGAYWGLRSCRFWCDALQPDCLPGLLLTSPSGKEERKHGSSTMSHVSCNVCLKWRQPCISHGVEGWKDVNGRVLTVCCE